MHRLLMILLIALAGVPHAWAQSRLVHVEGKALIAPDGQVLRIKGINLGNWLTPEGYMFKFKVARAPRDIDAGFARLLGRAGADAFWRTFRDRYVAEDDIRFIKSVGFNTVRIPLHYGLFMADDGTIRGEGWALLDRAMGWIRQAGLYAIFDLHAAPGGQTGISHDDGPGHPLMFYVPRDRDLTVKFWQEVARHYAGDPAILGYDLLNEPIAPYHDTATLNPRLEPFYKRVTAAIRAVDPQRIVFLAGGQWSSNFGMFGPPFADNLVYTYHSFWGSTKRDTIQRHLNFSNLYNVPLFLGETGEFKDEWNEAFRKLHEAHGIGWAFWTYKNLDTPSTVVSITKPEGWDDLAAFVDGPPTGGPPDDRLVRAAMQYLENLKLSRTTVRWSYLASLGLKPGL